MIDTKIFRFIDSLEIQNKKLEKNAKKSNEVKKSLENQDLIQNSWYFLATKNDRCNSS